MNTKRNPTAKPEFVRPEESRQLVQKLLETRLFAKYERSFSAASGLPLVLRPIESFQMASCRSQAGNPFCSLLAKSRKGCVACLQHQSDLESTAQRGTKTLRCFANLHDTMIPVYVGERIVAYLQTGQVALKPFSSADFDFAHSELILKGIDIDARTARNAYFQSQIMRKDQYQGFVKMLELFAESLGAAANALLLAASEDHNPPLVQKAVRHMERHFDRKISLAEIAKVSGASEGYFCKVFKSETGLSFVNYLTRLRSEHAKKRLRETDDRVSDIAFACGFESIAQFNKSFKSIAGQSPSSYRKLATA